MFERFTKSARAVTVGAQAGARRLGHNRIGAEHLLLSLVTTGDAGVGSEIVRALGVTAEGVEAEISKADRRGGLGPTDAEALEAIGINLDEVSAKIEEAFGPGALRPGQGERRRRRHIPFGDDAKKVLERSLREALKLKHNYIGTEHILLALSADRGLAGGILETLGAAPLAVRAEVIKAVRRAS
jgi:ATP-dependent Clp protease ATP-binding subunit ClpA